MGMTDLLIAAIAIVLFIVLGRKLFNNAKQMRGTDKKASHNPEDFMHEFIDQPELWIKLAKGIPASSPDEDVRLTLMVNTTFQEFENQCELAEAGELEDSEIQALEESVHRICAMPGVEKYLSDLKPDLSPRLKTIIDQQN